MSKLRFLVVSIGNPWPYAEGRHSAGHMVLNRLQTMLGPKQPPFRHIPVGKKPALGSLGPKYTLIKSPTVMNISGPWVLAAWRRFVAEQQTEEKNLALALVQDELELDTGAVKTRTWSQSHRGHNGVKSVKECLIESEYPEALWARLCVGIGRPEYRYKAVVAKYVLAEVPKLERQLLETDGTSGVLRHLVELEDQWLAKHGSKDGD